MNNKSIPFIVILSVIIIASILNFTNVNVLYIRVVIILGFLILIAFAFLKGDKLKRHEITNLPLSKIGNLQEGIVKIKGKLHCDSSIKSKLTAINCIGYSYRAKKWIYKKEFGKSKRDRYKIIESKKECLDFYIFDATGKVKVFAKDITILSDLNHHEIKKRQITYTENLLLTNQQEYYIIGKATKKQNKIVISKSEEKELIIASPNDYDIYLNTSQNYRIGCGIFLVILLIAFFLFMFGNLF